MIDVLKVNFMNSKIKFKFNFFIYQNLRKTFFK